jgi:CBS domain-containing protein
VLAVLRLGDIVGQRSKKTRIVTMMKASDVMVPHVITVGPELDVKAVANTLATNRISAVPVIDINNNLLGIVSEGDLTRRIASGAERKRPARSHGSKGPKAKDVMTHQVITVDPDTPLQEIANLFEQHGIKRVPVVKKERLVGIVSRANLVQALATQGMAFFDRVEADGALRKAIMTKIHKLRSKGSIVDVIVSQGTVNLWGTVRTENEKSAIRVAAEKAPGVRKVNDRLRIFSG